MRSTLRHAVDGDGGEHSMASDIMLAIAGPAAILNFHQMK
jgi:hypothetical protein